MGQAASQRDQIKGNKRNPSKSTAITQKKRVRHFVFFFFSSVRISPDYSEIKCQKTIDIQDKIRLWKFEICRNLLPYHLTKNSRINMYVHKSQPSTSYTNKHSEL